MTEPRFFVPPSAIRGGRVVFSAEQSHQIARVFRLRPGAAVFVLDNAGQLYTVRLEQVSPRQVVGRVVGVEPASHEPPLRLTVFQALLKGDRMDFVFQKGTEIGVTRFVPMITARTVVRRFEKRPRWERIVVEAAEQCRRGRVPEVADIVDFQAALAEAAAAERGFIAHNGPEVPPFWDVAGAQGTPPADVAVLIGPEGGFTDEEVALAVQVGLQPVRLGPRTLRAETAALVAATLVLYHWGDVGK